MPDEEGNETVGTTEPEVKEIPQEQGIILTKQEYAELMSRIARAEARIEAQPQKEEPEEEEPEEPITQDSFSKMTPAQFFETVLKEVEKKVSQPVMLAVATLQTKMEIQEAAGKYKDFWDYEADIKKTAMANPTISISDAYLLVKSKKGPSLKEPQEPKKEPKPKEPEPQQPFGLKPGLNKDALKQQPKTIREAAKMALDSLNLETKEGEPK